MTQEAVNAIKLVQHPIIKHSLEVVGSKVSERIDALNITNQLATEDTIKALKEMRAELNKEAKEFEGQRKTIKDAVLLPYNDFESTYKTQILEKYKSADDLLKTKINEFEMKIKQEKKTNLVSYFNELVEIEQISWLSFDRLGIDVTLSTTEKKYKEQILEHVQKVVDDLDLIKTENHSAEILVEFKKSLNASQAIRTVRERKQAEKEETDRLLNERTNRRTAKLRSLSFVYHDLTRTYNWIKDEMVMVLYSDIENLSDEDWLKKYSELEVKTKVQEEVKPEVLQAPIVEKPKQETVQEKKEDLFEVVFSVTESYDKVKALGEYLKSNNYNYKQIK